MYSYVVFNISKQLAMLLRKYLRVSLSALLCGFQTVNYVSLSQKFCYYCYYNNKLFGKCSSSASRSLILVGELLWEACSCALPLMPAHMKSYN